MTGCHGFCEQGPLLVMQPQGIFYKSVQLDDVYEIVSKTAGRQQVDRAPALHRPDHRREDRPRARRALLRPADPPPARPQRPDRPHQHRGLHRRRRLRGAGQGAEPDVARAGDRRGHPLRAAGTRRRRLSHRASSGSCAAPRPATSSTSSATPTRAIRAPTWTAASWRATPTGCWRAWSSAPMPWAPRAASSTSGPSTRWPSNTSRSRWRRCASTACWARTSWDPASASTSRCASAPGPSSAARRRR